MTVEILESVTRTLFITAAVTFSAAFCWNLNNKFVGEIQRSEQARHEDGARQFRQELLLDIATELKLEDGEGAVPYESGSDSEIL